MLRSSSSSPAPSSLPAQGTTARRSSERGTGLSPPGISHSSSFSPTMSCFLPILTNFHVFLLCSFCRTAFPCQDPAPVTIPRLGPCGTVSLREACVPGPSFLHPRRIRPCGVCSVSTPTALGRRRLGSRRGQRPRPGDGAAPPAGTLTPGGSLAKAAPAAASSPAAQRCRGRRSSRLHTVQRNAPTPTTDTSTADAPQVSR